LRNLSELGVVRIADGTEVLLPGNVPSHMEQQRTEPDNTVRRDIYRAGITPKQAAENYIAEREEKRMKGIDIPLHRHYKQGDEGSTSYAGTRQVGGHSLALLKKGDDMIVMPVDEATANRISRLKVGDQITLKPDGSITRKGRSR
jgi:D-lyxose ketol-isomerase